MQTLSAISSPTREKRQRRRSQMLERMLGTRSEFALHDQHSPHRKNLQAYIADCFARAYRAEVSRFSPLLLELRFSSLALRCR
jgi:hypothetical protein